MKILWLGVLCSIFSVDVLRGQQVDTLSMSEVEVRSVGVSGGQNTISVAELVRNDFLQSRFTGNLMQTLSEVPGIQSMNIGSGFAKPMIRGMGFNRIVVSENGMKQEGQQWGADHGLELDAFNVESVRLLKGANSLLYGSDAMGGVLEIARPMIPDDDTTTLDFTALYRSVSGSFGGSLMWKMKRNGWFLKARYTEQHFGDYRIPTDSIVYLTRRIPVYGRLENTAGEERDGHLFAYYSHGDYRMNVMCSDAYQKCGFFSGSHGIPDVSSSERDGRSYNIGLPYSRVNHFKISTLQQYATDWLSLSCVLGYQANDREEWSSFHTHYASQTEPEKNPDLELKFGLDTYSGSLKAESRWSDFWNIILGYDVQLQRNKIAGYSFLLPAYRRMSMGGYGVCEYRSEQGWNCSWGVRYDNGRCRVYSYEDLYVEAFMRQRGSSEAEVESYKWRSLDVRRSFGDWSYTVGFSWPFASGHQIKINVGRSFRLPGANELASNGVHHGTFRHEQGDPNLNTEKGWQVDLQYRHETEHLKMSLSPYLGYYENYIYLRPTGKWSVLPDAGQIYRYTGAEALFVGMELNVELILCQNIDYQLTTEYTRSSNLDEHTAMCYSPPMSIRNVLTWHNAKSRFYVENHCIARQNRVARNENPTEGAVLFNLGGSTHILENSLNAEVSVNVQNISNKKYFNHLSFYRQIEIPEPGRNVQLIIKIPIK